MGDPPRSPTTDFYNILGIPKTATLKDMCKAYKSLVKKWHPDKNPSNKAEAELKFREINEAYKALNETKWKGKSGRIEDPPIPIKNEDEKFFSRRSFLSRTGSRRSHTPSPRPTYLSKSGSRNSSAPVTPTPESPKDRSKSSTRWRSSESESASTEIPAHNLSRNVSRRSTTPIIFSQSTARRKPAPIERKLECTLEELCNGCVKKIKITRDVIKDPGVILQEVEILTIQVKPGWKRGTKVTFEGKGDERPGHLPADIIFKIEEKRHPLFKRVGDDLEIGVEIPLLNALTGCSLSVPLLGREKMSLSFEDTIIYPGYQKVLQGQGMPKPKEQGKRGDLRINFLINFPEELSDEQRSEAYSILQHCC